MASSAIQVAFSAAKRIAPAASLRAVSPRSQALATAYTYALAAFMIVYMSASLPCMSWNSPIGWPNCLRSCR